MLCVRSVLMLLQSQAAPGNAPDVWLQLPKELQWALPDHDDLDDDEDYLDGYVPGGYCL